LDADERAAVCDALAGAVDQLVAAGLLPPPVDPLPALGTRVEVIRRPSTSPHITVPACRYATGVVTRQHRSPLDGHSGPE
jgi:hypothetical protein